MLSRHHGILRLDMERVMIDRKGSSVTETDEFPEATGNEKAWVSGLE
jgi:hypothetical protein